MPVDPMFWLATAAFAWGLSLASYRWFAIYNGWPMGEWQAHRPGLPIAIGMLAMVFSVFFAIARGGETVLILPLFGVMCAFAWTALLRVGAQSALLLAPISVIALLAIWTAEANRPSLTRATPSLSFDRGSLLGDTDTYRDRDTPVILAPLDSERTGTAARYLPPAATDREADISDRDRGITRSVPRVPPLTR